MEKRGTSSIILLVVMPLLVITLVGLFWAFVKPILEEQQEQTEIRSQLALEEYTIKKITIGPNGQIKIIVTRGPGDIYIENETTIEKFADIVFVMDTTGSMNEELEALKNTIQAFATELQAQDINARLAFVEFKDYEPPDCGSQGDFPFEVHEFEDSQFTTTVTTFIDLIDTIDASGGNDLPESHLTAIREASELSFDPSAKKYIIAISDARPHAKDCCTTSPIPSSTYFDGWELDPNEECYGEGWVTTFNMNNCYDGPEYIADLTDTLVSEEIVFYYIAKDALCDASDGKPTLWNKMTGRTGGQFFEYSESGEADELTTIIPQLADEIVTEYGSQTVTDYLLVVGYGEDGETQTAIIQGPPALPYESGVYEVLLDEIDPIVKIEIYPIVVTSDGTEIRGPLLDEWYP